jgi:hypothetical protein
MSAIVEAVETAAQVEIVRSFNADAAQGFFFARPIGRADARSFAEGPEIPVFSRSVPQTLLLSEGTTAPLDAFLTEHEQEPEAKDAGAPVTPRQIPDVAPPSD